MAAIGNALPEKVIVSDSIIMFKRRLDRHLNKQGISVDGHKVGHRYSGQEGLFLCSVIV